MSFKFNNNNFQKKKKKSRTHMLRIMGILHLFDEIIVTDVKYFMMKFYD